MAALTRRLSILLFLASLIVIASACALQVESDHPSSSTPPSPRDIVNPKNDNVFHHLTPGAAHQALIAIIFIAFWLGAVGWDIASTLAFDLRILRETRYSSLFSVCSSSAYLSSRYFTFAWLLRTLLDAISAVDDCMSRFKVSATLYGFAICSTYLVFALRTANLWNLKGLVVGPLFVNLAAIGGATLALGQNMHVTRLGTSAFCSYTLKGAPSYIILCLCGLFDILNFAFLGLKLNRSGWRGMLRCLLPLNKPNYDHAEIRQMLLQRTGVFTLVQLGLYVSIAVLYAVLSDQQATYKLMQVAAFHGITCNMNSSIFRGAWSLTREHSPCVVNTPPAYQAKWPNAYTLSSRDERVRSYSTSTVINQGHESRSGPEKTFACSIDAYIEGERARGPPREERQEEALPRHRSGSAGVIDLSAGVRRAAESCPDDREDIRYDTILNQLSRARSVKHDQQHGTTTAKTRSLAYSPSRSSLRSFVEENSAFSLLRPAKSTTSSVAASEAGPSVRPGSSSAAHVGRHFGLRAIGSSRASTSDGIVTPSGPGVPMDPILVRPHTASAHQGVPGPVRIIAPSSCSTAGARVFDRCEEDRAPVPPPLMRSMEPASVFTGDSVGSPHFKSQLLKRSAVQRDATLEQCSSDLANMGRNSSHRPSVTAPPSVKGNLAVSAAKSESVGSVVPFPLSTSRPNTAPTKAGNLARASGTLRQRSTSVAGQKWQPMRDGHTPINTSAEAAIDLRQAFADTIQSDSLKRFKRGPDSANADEGRPRTSRGGPIAPFGVGEPLSSDGKYSRYPSLVRVSVPAASTSGDSELRPSRPSTAVKRAGVAYRTSIAATYITTASNSTLGAEVAQSRGAESAADEPPSAIAETYRQLEAMASISSASSDDEGSSSSSSSSSMSTAVIQSEQ